MSDGIDWAKFSVDWMATVRGRVGYLLQPSLLAYATAGLGMYHAELSSSVPGYNISGTETDLVFGLGLESKWSHTTSVRVEYLGFQRR
ncbi:MAG TPA: outer membrane beta-barrel protein [Hyphomicrobiaceae bacterium]|nr:outer membrane beta-barrel protein [Hyphomicrobiaceae bacterium]